MRKKKKMYKKTKSSSLVAIISAAIGLVGLAAFTIGARADNLSAGPLTISYAGTGPIFSEVAIAPGATFNKDITVTNNGTVSHSFALAAKNVSGVLSDKIYLEPIGGEPWKMSIKALSEIPEVSKTVISSIAPGQSAAVTLKAEFDESADNNYQDKNVSFDLVFGSQEPEPAPSPSVSPSPAAPTGGGTGGGIALLTRFTPAGAISPVASPTVSPSVSPSATVSPEGEVKGEQAKNEGELWLLLLIVPVGVAASMLIPLSSRTGIRTPIITGVVAAVLSFFFKGTLEPWLFWLILIAEVVIVLVAGWFIISRYKKKVAEEEKAASRKKK